MAWGPELSVRVKEKLQVSTFLSLLPGQHHRPSCLSQHAIHTKTDSTPLKCEPKETIPPIVAF